MDVAAKQFGDIWTHMLPLHSDLHHDESLDAATKEQQAVHLCATTAKP